MADTDFSCFYAFYRTFQEQANKDNNDYNHLPFPVRLSWFAGRLVDEKHMLVINSIPFLNWITHTPTMTTRTLTFLTILLVDLLCWTKNIVFLLNYNINQSDDCAYNIVSMLTNNIFWKTTALDNMNAWFIFSIFWNWYPLLTE